MRWVWWVGLVLGWPGVGLALPPPLLPVPTVDQALAGLPRWQRQGQVLTLTATFPDFVQAMAFVNRLVAPAERLGHHPEIKINYNRVTLVLTTHDAGGLTQLDVDLAQVIQGLLGSP
ncbi:pterin-4-alpha-carbinolamine dehydratase [Gloeomargarita lithophora Alchichica-D10]|uniref:Putative pterin-4-alpha-carbinolamine dehydratase n=1 Tax=Gloeomargarita lithophora Alchichica-D10 TaxID=1188229 RepID=A0A1J0AFA1_9CYAN|nr:4a-hydroxytetrahydrobiopterin dehydratase [Gloeomargarita lithophora]APB34579.1 pterin-4-alpha-carbinolamine dehydratase [Gloeomargarita lithophora Alchichica-D10]